MKSLSRVSPWLVLALPVLALSGCKSVQSDCGCSNSSYSVGTPWTSWSPTWLHKSSHDVVSCTPCQTSDAPIAKSSSGKVVDSHPPIKSNKIVVPVETPKPLPSSPE